MEQHSDQALAAEVAGGDAGALRTLYNRYEVQTFNFLLRLTGNREMARDLVQETFTRVWTMARLFDPGRGAFKSWLFTIALNLTRNELSKKRYSARHVAPEAADGPTSEADSPHAVLARSEVRRSVAEALARLSPHLREVVVMKIFHQLKFREIAGITRTPEGTLKARFHRAVAELREHLGSLGPGSGTVGDD
jgi:RNA polymerase sigma-70 factor (ECF subfamily)